VQLCANFSLDSGPGQNSAPAFLSEFSTTTSGQVAGAHGSQNGKILRQRFWEKKVFLYMGLAGEGFGRVFEIQGIF
jgi:hypothetical protein